MVSSVYCTVHINIHRRSYYLLVAITQDGYLKFEEDREEAAYGAEFKNRNFLNGNYIPFLSLLLLLPSINFSPSFDFSNNIQ